MEYKWGVLKSVTSEPSLQAVKPQYSHCVLEIIMDIWYLLLPMLLIWWILQNSQ